MRKTLFIVIALLLIILIVGLVWYFFFRETSPFGTQNGNGGFGSGGGDVEIPTPPDVGVPVPNAGDEVAPRLFKITDGPVAKGVIALTVEVRDPFQGTSTPATRDVEVRYADRATGNLYRYLLGDRTLERLTNRTLPGVQEASWARNGSRAFLRYLADDGAGERIETYALPADGTEGYLLEPNLSEVIAGTSTVLTVLPSTTGSIGTKAELSGAGAFTLFSTPLSSLRFFASGGTYVAATRPSANSAGYAFYLGPDGQFTRALGPLRGLNVLPSPSGERLLYSSNANATFDLALLTLNPAGAMALPLATMADKCVWAADEKTIYCAVPRSLEGTQPDDWYQGEVSFSDRIWEIDLESRIASLVFDPFLLADTDIDAIALTVDASTDILVFTNKSDGSLWAYDL